MQIADNKESAGSQLQFKLQPTEINLSSQQHGSALKSIADSMPVALEEDPVKGEIEGALLPKNSSLVTEEKIVKLTDEIDGQIVQLDNRLDMVLEKHETDFLAAYRYHMVKVQTELTEMKTVGNQADLQKKQDKRLGQLEKEINHLKSDCMSLMKYCNLQKQKITDMNQKRKELREDQSFLDEEALVSKVDNVKLKGKIAKLHNDCKDQTSKNEQATEEISQMVRSRDQMGSLRSFNNPINATNPSSGLITSKQQNPSVDRAQKYHQIMMEQSVITEQVLSTSKIPGVPNGKMYDSVNQPTLAGASLVHNSIAERNTDYETVNNRSKDPTQNTLSKDTKGQGSLNQNLGSISQEQNIEIQQPSVDATGFGGTLQQSIETQQMQNQSKDLMGSQGISPGVSLNQHTLLEEKYVQEAQALASYVPKYMKKLPKSLKADQGPSACHTINAHHYHQKLTNHIKKSVAQSGSNPELFADKIEGFFKEGLSKKFLQIQQLKQQIALQQQKTEKKRAVDLRVQKLKVDQRQLSKTLVTAFKQSVDSVVQDKTSRAVNEAASDLKRERDMEERRKKIQGQFQSTKGLNMNDKKKILENFVENDDALGQLLDFISNQYIQLGQHSGQNPGATGGGQTHGPGQTALGGTLQAGADKAVGAPNVSMSICDVSGNRIEEPRIKDTGRNFTTQNNNQAGSDKKSGGTNAFLSSNRNYKGPYPIVSNQTGSFDDGLNHQFPNAQMHHPSHLNSMSYNHQIQQNPQGQNTLTALDNTDKQRQRIQYSVALRQHSYAYQNNSAAHGHVHPPANQQSQNLPGQIPPTSRGDESVGVESTFRFKGRGSDFINQIPIAGGMIASNAQNNQLSGVSNGSGSKMLNQNYYIVNGVNQGRGLEGASPLVGDNLGAKQRTKSIPQHQNAYQNNNNNSSGIGGQNQYQGINQQAGIKGHQRMTSSSRIQTTLIGQNQASKGGLGQPGNQPMGGPQFNQAQQMGVSGGIRMVMNERDQTPLDMFQDTLAKRSTINDSTGHGKGFIQQEARDTIEGQSDKIQVTEQATK